MKLTDYEQNHLQLLRSHLAECTVLLKCNGDFPLDSPCPIAAYGSGVRRTVKGGTGSGEVNSRYFVTIEQGLREAGFTITTNAWLDAYDEVRLQARKAFVKEIKARAKANHTMAVLEGMGTVMPEPEYTLPLEGDGETAIYVLSRISGEGNDRNAVDGDIKLNASEKRDILALNKKYAKFMLVLNVGGVVDLSDVAEVENILCLSQLGVETGTALADILLGKANPSGKLTTTWSAWEDYPTLGSFGDKHNTRYGEGIYVGYRYFDTVGKKAMFPFGYGLSYTNFSISVSEVKAKGDAITLQVSVTNTGTRPGKEVVQVYISSPEGKLDQPYQALAAFAKTSELAPGRTKKMTISFRLSDFASYDAERSAYILEAGNYFLRVGTNSADTHVAAVACLDRDAIITQVKSCCGQPDFTPWHPVKRGAPPIPENVPILAISADDIGITVVTYGLQPEIDASVKGLTNHQLALLNVGAFDPKAGALSVIGNAGQQVAGAAGETTSQLNALGIPTLVMADGPAGLRLSPQYYRDEKGIHSIGQGGLPESVLEFLPAISRWAAKRMSGGSKPKAGQEICEQYATALPIGTAIAQSWNLAFAESCGDIVGDEMERFGVHLWLAPALNIHRNIRCGRNFEYYSEDPLISGKFAAAITIGVQKHPGRGTTIKHYAANNQEYNRDNSNSLVDERALREIYLKGFGICVREAQPHAVMTAYNLLNNCHVSESRDLTEHILRSEFGFRGIVMTDWIVAAAVSDKSGTHPAPKAHRIAGAGSNLIMPGSKGDYKDILRGLKDGTLNRQQLEINATRLIAMAKKLAGK